MREMITVREAGHELRVQVLDGRAYVAIVAADGSEDADVWSRAVSLPARRLHALVRAAWADDQYGALGPLDPPLGPVDEPPDGPEPDEDPFREERLRFGWRDDWPDDDGLDGSGAALRAEGDLVPFPRQGAWGPSSSWGPAAWRTRERAPRSGLPWPAEDDAALRAAWLEADPAADRAELMRGLAARFERTTGGVLQRLHRVGCDPASPGAARFAPVLADAGGGVGQDPWP
ncbi:hypothetical protein [Actinomycetospora sp. TBRC 11914]|uniref:hypothetical protein n=1 Tax=Actinomycetospora sp. TBRC 11914 TaxID=2729387 RepID=UPI00145DBE88|nr:hypothetical protein [Actinomycetospora sp. TBRC 11914]NMO89896.1 hypothetical protein [Actinomycetospora sp. TBRC 11914]